MLGYIYLPYFTIMQPLTKSANAMHVSKIVADIEKRADIAKRLKCLNIFVTETFDRALEQARNLPTTSGPMHGVALAVKDCFSTQDVLTTCGSKMLANYTPPYTATVVQRLLNNGAVMIGKTNLDEFCMGASSTESSFGAVKNPWTLKLWRNTERNLNAKLESDWFLAGGSSGGSAASVAAGIADIALGSDTGGSTRNPAAYCGIIGFKPTYGLMSRHGLIPLTNSLDVPGIFARKVDRIAQTLDIVAGEDSLDSTCIVRRRPTYALDNDPSIENFTVGIPQEYFVPGLSLDVLQLWKRIAAILETDGKCRLRLVTLPHTKYSIICYHVLGEAEVASNMARYDGLEYGYRAEDKTSLNQLFALTRQRAFNEIVRRRILAGNYFLLKQNYQKYYLQSLKVRRLIANDFHSVFTGPQKVDVLLTPVTLGEAPLYTQWRSDDEGYERERSDDYFTQSVNMAGLPAISIPVGLSRNGLPVGLQLIGGFNQDFTVLQFAKWIERRVNFECLKLNDILTD